MTKEETLYKFWSSFGVPAFNENTVPIGNDVPEYPYITYQVITDSLNEPVYMSANLWDRDKSGYSAELENSKRIDLMSKRIGRGGTTVLYDGGAIFIHRGSPFAQSLSDVNDDMIKRKLINIEAEFISAD